MVLSHPRADRVRRAEGGPHLQAGPRPGRESLGLSAIFVALPPLILFVLLGGMRIKAHWAPVILLAVALVTATVVYPMPVRHALDAAALGAAFGAARGARGVRHAGDNHRGMLVVLGALQLRAARAAGIDPVLIAAASSSGGVLGKVVSPQNPAIGAAASAWRVERATSSIG